MKNLWMGLLVVVAITGLLFFASCGGPKEIETAPPESAEQADVSDMDAQQEEELAKQRALEEAEIMRQAKEAREMFLNEDVYFDYDQSVLTPEAQDILRRKAVWMQTTPDVKAIVEGHCDERGTTEYNLALGDRRAQSVKVFLEDLGIDGTRMSTISYGEEQPIDPGNNEEAWVKNRRAHFAID